MGIPVPTGDSGVRPLGCSTGCPMPLAATVQPVSPIPVSPTPSTSSGLGSSAMPLPQLSSSTSPASGPHDSAADWLVAALEAQQAARVIVESTIEAEEARIHALSQHLELVRAPTILSAAASRVSASPPPTVRGATCAPVLTASSSGESGSSAAYCIHLAWCRHWHHALHHWHHFHNCRCREKDPWATQRFPTRRKPHWSDREERARYARHHHHSNTAGAAAGAD